MPRAGPLEPELFYRRPSTVFERANSKHVAFECFVHDGAYYFCKADRDGRLVRGTELLLTRLADRLGIRTAEWAIIEHDGETFFGSKREISSADLFRTSAYLAGPHRNELGEPAQFPGAYLAQVLAFDLFVANPDRGAHNFLLVKDGSFLRLCAIDFADSDLSALASQRFPVATSTTVTVGSRYRQIHGAFVTSAVEMVERIEALPRDAFAQIVSDIPGEWMTDDRKGGLSESWGSPQFRSRLATLRSGLTDGSLV